MVVFTCGHCGEAVQKPKVEKHYLTKCRNLNPNLSCMDCFKDFYGQDYQSHTKCITEEQRYGGKDFIAKDKKGEQKQNTWVQMIKTVLDEQIDLPKNVSQIILTISQHTNTPRKKPKFINFIKNTCGHKTKPEDIDKAWELIAAKLPTLAQNYNSKQNQNTSNLNDSINDSVSDSVKGLHIKDNSSAAQSDDKQQNGTSDKGEKVKSKKELKEEKKKKKYEAALQSAAQPVEEIEEVTSKKEKKKKNKSELKVNSNEEDQNSDEKDGNSKNKKRKRVDTVNSVQDANEIENPIEVLSENIEVVNDNKNGVVNTLKIKKKKQKMEKNQTEESICLHDQNVANTAQPDEKGNFNWHAVIMSILEKKDGEIPFKRLQKKVLGEYSESTGLEVDDRIADKFIKKLRSAPNVRVDKNKVVLIS